MKRIEFGRSKEIIVNTFKYWSVSVQIPFLEFLEKKGCFIFAQLASTERKHANKQLTRGDRLPICTHIHRLKDGAYANLNLKAKPTESGEATIQRSCQNTTYKMAQ